MYSGLPLSSFVHFPIIYFYHIFHASFLFYFSFWSFQTMCVYLVAPCVLLLSCALSLLVFLLHFVLVYGPQHILYSQDFFFF